MIPTGIIAIIGIATSFLIAFLLERFGNRRRVKEIQEQINKINKEYMEATKKKDEKKMAELDKESDKLPALMKESMILNFKGMAISLPVIFIVPWVVKFLFPDFLITLPFNFPVPFRSATELIEWRSVFGPNGWFWLTFIIIGGVCQMIYSKIKEVKAKTTEIKVMKK